MVRAECPSLSALYGGEERAPADQADDETLHRYNEFIGHVGYGLGAAAVEIGMHVALHVMLP